jgi:hypothetical protein
MSGPDPVTVHSVSVSLRSMVRTTTPAGLSAFHRMIQVPVVRVNDPTGTKLPPAPAGLSEPLLWKDSGDACKSKHFQYCGASDGRAIGD